LSSPPARGDRRVILGWALYDFANSAYTTLVVTFIYAVYFTTQIAPDDGVTGPVYWSRAVTISALTVAFLSPFMGALADRSGYRRHFLVVATVLTIGTVCLLYFPLPGEIALALVLFVVSDIAYEMAGVFYNSYLPDVAPPDRIGRVSGYGWALGYLGGLLAMVVALVGFVQPEEPWFGLSKEAGQSVRATMILVGLWFAVFSIPFFLWVPEHKPARMPGTGRLLRETIGQLAGTFRAIRRYRQIVRLLLARLFYNDGLITVFAFGGAYAAVVFDFTLTDVMLFGLALNVTAGLGAFAMGFLDDRIGGKRTILITILGLSLGALGAVVATDRIQLWVAGLFLGIFVGPNQAASRSLLGRFVPHEKETEFYGFFALSGKAIAFMGPLLLGTFTGIFDSMRAGVATVIIFFVVGGILLLRVDEEEGKALARSGR
jgi:UMF1 family MFS transporter